MRKFLVTLLFISVSSLAFVSIQADVPTTATEITIGGTITLPVPTAIEPCTGGPGTATIVFNAVFHITSLGIDPETGFEIRFITSIMTGTFVVVTNDASEPTFTGRFVNNSEFQGTPPGLQFNRTAELIVVGTGSDGSRLTFLEIAHITRTPEGDITVSFDTPTCVSQ